MKVNILKKRNSYPHGTPKKSTSQAVQNGATRSTIAFTISSLTS
jgi:hypothetical protein